MNLQQTTGRELWSAILGDLELQVPRSTYETWLKNTTGSVLSDGSLVVFVPNAFTAEYLEQRILGLIHTTASKINHHPLNITFQIGNPTNAAVVPSTKQKAPMMEERMLLRSPQYTFDSFIVGTSNDLAYSAAHTVALYPGIHYNPLFIYSGAGLGKTHLLQAIAKQSRSRKLNCLYVTSEQFTNEFIMSIRERTADKFRARYRDIDMLLIDDIQFMAGKDQTQERFFHTFNDLHSNNRQVVITSDKSPSTLPYLEERLRSRFVWGLIADIQPPPIETRIAILQEKSRNLRVSLDPDVLSFIGTTIVDNIRSLEGALNRVVATARLRKEPISLTLAEHSLKEILQDIRRFRKSPDAIIQAAADIYGFTPEDLLSQRRHKSLAEARQLVMYILRKDIDLPVSLIGRLLGGKNHSTVIHAVNKITVRLKEDSTLANRLHSIKDNLALTH